ncbi:MAG: hypothetical protein FWG98_09880 [Candidatus Cloacimonetes bacterium]|nr:hypothetical protein [Candidatus Cloacimonadota bacterium]
MKSIFKSYKIKQFVFYTILVGLCFLLATCKSPTKPPEKDDGWKRIDLGARIFPGAISSDRFYVAYENGVAIFEDMTKPPDLEIKLDIVVLSIFPIRPRLTDKMIAYNRRGRSRNLYILDFTSKNVISVGTSDFGKYYDTEYSIYGVIQAIELDPVNKIHRFYAKMTKIVEEGAPLFIVYFDIQIDNENNMKLIDKGFWEFLTNDNIYIAPTENSIRYKNMVFYSYFCAFTKESTVAVIYDDLNFKILEDFQIGFTGNFWIWKDILYARLTTGDLRFTKDGENWIDFGSFEMGIANGNEIDDYLFFSRGINGIEYIYFYEEKNEIIYLYQIDSEFEGIINSINKYQEYLVITTYRAIYYHLFDDLLNTKTFIKKYNFIGE